MSRNIHLTPQRYQPVAALNGSHDDDTALRAVVVDENTYWTGREYKFILSNNSQYTRWNRIVVTNLQHNDEYEVFTPNGRLEENELIPIDPNEEIEVEIVLGGETHREPSESREFRVYVQEYSTPDARLEPRNIDGGRSVWIPNPDANSILLTTDRKEIRIRPWPWPQKVRFGASLVNRSYLPIEAFIRALPTDDSKEAGLEGTHEKLVEPIPPQHEQHINCEVALEKKLKSPVTLTVGADAAIASLNRSVSTAPQAVHIVPVPFMKIWQDWLVVACAAFLAVWLLFGMPPFVSTYSEVELDFEQDLPIGIKASDLKVTLKPKPTLGRTPSLPAMEGRLLTPGKQNHLVYAFDWGRQWRGFRWTWYQFDLHLSLEPQGKGDNPLFNIQEQNYDPENTTISYEKGVSPSRIVQRVEFTHIAPAYVTIPSGTPPKAYTCLIRDSGNNALLYNAQSDGRDLRVPVTMNKPTRSVTVEVTVAGAKLPNSRSLELTPGKPTDFGAWNSADASEIKPIQPPVPDPTKPALDPTGKKPAQGAALGTDHPVPLPLPFEPPVKPNIKPANDKLPHSGGQPKDTVPQNADLITKWCNTLNVTKPIDALVEESAKPDALKVKAKIIPKGDTFTLQVKFNADCYYQVYNVYQGQNVRALFGINSRGIPVQDPDPGNERPLPVKAGTSDIPITHHEGQQGLIILAWRDYKPDSNKDLVTLFDTDDARGWSIVEVDVP